MGRRKIERVEAPLPDPPKDPRKSALERVTGKMDMWRPARQVLTKVEAVPTIFPWLDYATRVRGLPTQRIIIVHGPSAEGKTAMLIGLGLSFLKAGYGFAHVDAEYTTPMPWLEGLMVEHADNPLFVAMRPKSYEEVVDAVRQLLRGLIDAKKEGTIPKHASFLIGVDSLRKLTPENFLAKIAKHGAQGKQGSVDGMNGMGAAIKAKMNADWFDELTPLLYESGAAMVIIARESENRDKAQGIPDWKLTGGRAVLFESSLMMRVERDWERVGTFPNQVTIGERHDVAIYKSKVAGKDDKEDVFSFWTSNGKVAPEGFDPSRDLLELGIVLGVVRQAGAWFTFGGKRWQGKAQAAKRLVEDAALRAELDEAVRARFDDTAVDRPKGYDPKTGEVRV